VGFKLPSAGVTPAPSDKKGWGVVARTGAGARIELKALNTADAPLVNAPEILGGWYRQSVR
jgi:hypothetical protein